MLDFTFLTEEQVFGNDRLDIIRKKGTKCELTDFSIFLGGYVSGNYLTDGEKSRKDCTGWWWLKTPCQHQNVARIVTSFGSSYFEVVFDFSGGARPSVSYSSIASFASNKVRGSDGILEVEYGEYPQTVVSEEFAETLEGEYLNGTINETGKSYTNDSAYDKYSANSPFHAQTYTEYEFKGKKYIRIIGNLGYSGRYLSNGRTIQYGRPHWIEVEPIKWIIDEKADIALSKKLIFSGIFFNREVNYKGDFSKTDIKKFMDEYFTKEIVPNKKLRQEKHKEINGKRKGIKVKTINVERIQEITIDNKIELKKDNEEERPKVKRK